MKTRLIVQKYGGTSVATTEKIKKVAQRVVATRRQGHQVVVVVSAMGNTTDRLLASAREVADDPLRRELDILLSTGELTSMSLLAMAIRSLGVEAVSLTGGQSGIVTNDVHNNARILRIHTGRVREELARGTVVVVAGFQGVSTTGEVTTLGRGGSDTTATALAAALGADSCQILTDVDCVYSADPRKVPCAQPLFELHGDEMQEMAWHGAQVMKAEAVEFAQNNGIGFEIGSAFSETPKSRISVCKEPREEAIFVPRRAEVAGVSGRTDLLRLSFAGSALPSGFWNQLFELISGYDLVFGRLNSVGGPVDLLLSTLEIPNPEQLRKDLDERFGGLVSVDGDLGAVSLIGFGLGSRPGALFDALRALEETGIEILDAFTGRESLSFLIAASQVDEGVLKLHRTFVETSSPVVSLRSREDGEPSRNPRTEHEHRAQRRDSTSEFKMAACDRLDTRA
ncbi:MAG TPA: aspartate kinase [Thermoanaerobaculia bacterium]|nr:aspartate kinase [Thermoanaerobaculia bacterium]